MQIITLIIAPYLPLLIMIGIWRWRYQPSRLRTPVRDKLLRSPGESLMQHQKKLSDDVSEALIIVLFGPCIVIALTHSTAGSEKSGLVVPLIAYALVCVPALCWLWRLLTRQRNNHLGLLGERAVGEELNKLMLEGCHVYHDFKKDNGGNIDHVVVASSGVYCIETKCRRKGGAIDGRKDYEIVFDGERLHFPHTTDSYGLDQTKGNSSHLGQYLSSAIGEKVYAKGILTFPGWFVTTRKPIPNVRVLNPKQIRKAILGDKQGVLNGKQIKQIVHQLDQKCRDVEF